MQNDTAPDDGGIIKTCVTALKRAEQLAGIADDWNLGQDGKVEIDGKWVACHSLKKEFRAAITKAEGRAQK